MCEIFRYKLETGLRQVRHKLENNVFVSDHDSNVSDHDSNVSDHDSNRLPSGGNLGWGPSDPNPSCLGTVIGPSAQPLWGAFGPRGGFAPIRL